MEPKKSTDVHLRVKPGSALERFLSEQPGSSATNKLHDLAAFYEAVRTMAPRERA